jgi:hypothetical protein
MAEDLTYMKFEGGDIGKALEFFTWSKNILIHAIVLSYIYICVCVCVCVCYRLGHMFTLCSHQAFN